MSRINSLTILMIIIFAIGFAVSVPHAAFAEPNVADWVSDKEPAAEKPEPKPEAPEEQSLFGIIAKLVFYTLLILGMIYGLIKFLAMRQKKFQPNQAVKSLGGTPLGNNKSLQLVKVGGKVFLVGVGDDITLLKEFGDAEDIGAIEKDLEKPQAMFLKPSLKLPNWKKSPTQGFEQLFAQSLHKQKQKQEEIKSTLLKTDGKAGNSK